MAARFRTILYTFAGTDPVSLRTILNNTLDDWIGSLTLRAGASNAGTITWLDGSSGTAGGFLLASEAAAFDLATKYIVAGGIFLKASSANDTVYITVVG